jgi:hypothetical protein
MVHHVFVMLHHRLEIPTYKTQKGYTGKDAGPTRGFTASPGVGPGATVGTLKTGYPCVQAPSQDERQDGRTCRVFHGSRLLAQGSSGAAMCLVAPAPTTRARGSSEAAMCPMALALVSWHRTAPGPPHASWLQLLPPRPTTALGPPRALWPPSPVSWHRRALGPPHAPWAPAPAS